MISHGKRWKFAFRAFFSLIFHGRIAYDILATFVPGWRPQTDATPAAAAPATEPQPAEPSRVASSAPDGPDRATQMLMLLQREGRFVDFVMEDLAGYADAQIGAAVRDVHSGCRTALSRYLSLAPVLDDQEGARVTLDRGADPARIKVVGHIGTAAVLQGVVRHRGWEVTRTDLPPLTQAGRAVVAPAEVEVA